MYNSQLPDHLKMTTGTYGGNPVSSPGLFDSLSNWGDGISDWWGNTNILDKTDVKTGTVTQGWGMPALGAASSIFNSWIGLNQLDLAKKSLSEQKRQFDMNWSAQRSNINRDLVDRQQRRIAAGDPNAQDVASYMAKWGIN